MFQNSTATTPLAISTTTAIYVLYGSTTTTTTTQTCNGVTCRVTYTYNNEQSRTASGWCDKDTEAEDGGGAARRPWLRRFVHF